MVQADKRKARKRRTTDQIVADLEAKIASVKKRAATKQFKATPEGRAFFAAVKALDKAIALAKESGPMRASCEAARAILSDAMIELELEGPRAGRPRRAATPPATRSTRSVPRTARNAEDQA